MNSMKNKYQDALDLLDREYMYFLTHVLKIGRPESANWIPTACVAMEKNEKAVFDPSDFRFYFNDDFAETLDVDSMAFILAHETLHVVLNHLKLAKTFVNYKALDKLKDMRNCSKSELKAGFEAKRNMTLLNIAADCVINDYLVENGMRINGEISKNLCRGEDWINTNAAYLTVTDVFERIKNQQKDQKDGGEGEPVFIKGDGSSGGYSPLDSHDWILDPDIAEKMADAVDDFNKKLDDSESLPSDIFNKKLQEEGDASEYQKAMEESMKPGDRDANMEGFARDQGVSLAWAKLLDELNPDMFKIDGIAPPMLASFHRRPRKLSSSAFREVNLPVYRREERITRDAKEIPSMVICLDVSGSIGRRDAERFVALARTIPQNRIKLFPMVFQTTYQKIDLENPRYSQGGGTDFNAIHHFIEKEVKPELKGKSPKAVVIITDGAATMNPNFWPTEEESKFWLWLISPIDRSSWSNIIKERGKKKLLDDYIT